jgi:hypothetical protein
MFYAKLCVKMKNEDDGMRFGEKALWCCFYGWEDLILNNISSSILS